MLKRIALISAAVILISSVSYAERIILKSGEEIDGVILERTGDTIEVGFDGIGSTYYLDEVDSIDGEEPVIFSGQASPDISAQAKAQAPLAQGNIQPAPAPSAVKNIADISIGMALLALFFILSIYIYTSICLQLIAKKTDAAPAWMAWIPVANIFLMCKIASISYWWILLLPLSFFRYVGPFVSVCLFGFLWYRIALARNKPGWIGILAVIPIVNLAIYGYLAFSDKGTPLLRDISLPPNQPKENPPA